MPPEAKKYLVDVQQACERIVRFTVGKSFSEYAAEELLRAAVERQFEIIGESLNRLAGRYPTAAATIPDLREIIAFRNRLIHGYDTIDHAIVWGVVEGKLPGLYRRVQELLA